MSEEQYHTLKGQVFNALQNVTASNLKPAIPSQAPTAAPTPAPPPTERQPTPLPRRTATITSDSQTLWILPPQAPMTTATASGSSSSLVYSTPSQVGFVQDKNSRHNSGLSFPDITQVSDVNMPQVFIASPATPSTSQQPQQQQLPQ